MSADTDPAHAKMRADKWLWHARFFKTRGTASKVIAAGHLRVNGDKVSKPATLVRVGDVLTFAQSRAVRVIRIVALSSRRGPASDALLLYVDLDPPKPRGDAVPPEQAPAPKFDGKGRPSKKDRRNLPVSRGWTLD